LNAIAVFVAVAEARSFPAPANRLGLTRPAVSQTIARLERRLGTARLARVFQQRQPDRGGNVVPG